MSFRNADESSEYSSSKEVSECVSVWRGGGEEESTLSGVGKEAGQGVAHTRAKTRLSLQNCRRFADYRST